MFLQTRQLLISATLITHQGYLTYSSVIVLVPYCHVNAGAKDDKHRSLSIYVLVVTMARAFAAIAGESVDKSCKLSGKIRLTNPHASDQPYLMGSLCALL